MIWYREGKDDRWCNNRTSIIMNLAISVQSRLHTYPTRPTRGIASLSIKIHTYTHTSLYSPASICSLYNLKFCTNPLARKALAIFCMMVALLSRPSLIFCLMRVTMPVCGWVGMCAYGGGDMCVCRSVHTCVFMCRNVCMYMCRNV